MDLSGTIEVNINVRLPQYEARLDAIMAELQTIRTGVQMAQATLDDVVTAVTDETTVIDGVVTLLDSLAAQLTAAKNDPVKIQAIADGMSANKQKLADAVTRNTPSSGTGGGSTGGGTPTTP